MNPEAEDDSLTAADHNDINAICNDDDESIPWQPMLPSYYTNEMKRCVSLPLLEGLAEAIMRCLLSHSALRWAVLLLTVSTHGAHTTLPTLPRTASHCLTLHCLTLPRTASRLHCLALSHCLTLALLTLPRTAEGVAAYVKAG